MLLDFELLFTATVISRIACIKGCGWGQVSSQRQVIPAYTIIGLFEVAMSPRNASHRPSKPIESLRDVSLTQG